MNLFLCNFLSEWKEFVQVYFEFCWNAVFLEREQRKERRGKLRGEGGEGGRPPPSANDEKEENAENVT